MVISKAHKEWEKARKFLTRNKNNQEHRRMAEYKEIFDRNKDLAAKYNKRIRIINKINQMKRNVENDIQPMNINNNLSQHHSLSHYNPSINSYTHHLQPHQQFIQRMNESQQSQNRISSQPPFQSHTQSNPQQRQPASQINNQSNSQRSQSPIQINTQSHQRRTRRGSRLHQSTDQHKCDNCHRKQVDEPEEPYRLHFHIAHSSRIRKQGTFKLVKAYTGRNARNYNLCQECFDYLVEERDPVKCAWPTFLWLLLTGTHKSIFNGEHHFFCVYGGDVIWRFIPNSMRSWWIHSVKYLEVLSEVPHPYLECTVDYPLSLFDDKTIDLLEYNYDYNSGQLARVVKAMSNENVINRNVLCPWNCSVSCRDAGRVPLDLMIQRMLPKVILPLYSGSNKYRLVHWSCSQYFLQYGNYTTIMLNDKWPVPPSVILDSNGLKVLTCKSHDGGQDKMTLFTPRSPSIHIFNAEQSDQLAPCVQISRVTKSVKAKKYCTKFGMVQCRSGYSGTCTMNLTNHSDFSKSSFLLSEHEAASIIGRNDIRMLLNQKAANKEINCELADTFVNNAKKRFTINNLRQHTQGATYIRFKDMIRIHLFESSSSRQIKIIKDYPNQREKEVLVMQSWPIIINIYYKQKIKMDMELSSGLFHNFK